MLTVIWTRQQHWQLLFQQTQWLLIAMALLSALSVFLYSWWPGPRSNTCPADRGRARTLFLVPALMVAMAITTPQKQQQHLRRLMLTYVSGSVMVMVSTALTLRVL